LLLLSETPKAGLILRRVSKAPDGRIRCGGWLPAYSLAHVRGNDLADTLPPNGADSTTESASGERPNETEPANVGSLHALLSASSEDDALEGPIGPDTVPASVLAAPNKLVREELFEHLKKCRNIHCSFVPIPLQHYRHMRPQAICKAVGEIHKVLWTCENHELIVAVRKTILAKNKKLVDEVSKVNAVQNRKVIELLNSKPDGPRQIASIIWALKFEAPDAERLFRIAVPLALISSSPKNKKGSTQARRRDLNALRDELRITKRALKLAQRSEKKLKQAMRQKDQALEKSKRDLERGLQRYNDLVNALKSAQQKRRDAETAVQSLERDAKRGARANAGLRVDLRKLQDAQADLEVGRSNLAQRLGAERRRIEQLKLQLAAVPHGPDAVMAFLRTEEDRIQIERTITSGGAKRRADKEWSHHRKLNKAFLAAFPKYRQPPPVKIRPRTSLRLVTLGGSREVGRSCYLLELGRHRILVDCGIKPVGREELHPEIENLERIDALILTHAHTDHIGWVPALVRRFPELDIYCSEGTAALLPVILDDCHRHHMRRLVAGRERARYIANAEPVEEAYDEMDVHAVPNLVISCVFGEEETLPFGDVSIRFYPAGHILGAASVLIEEQRGRRIFVSGDFSSFSQLSVPAADWPLNIGEVDLLLLESTYGGRPPHKPREESGDELISFVRTTIEGEGSVILASFGLGRAQELLKLLKAARQEGQLPEVRVYFDGMIRRINPIYRKHARFEFDLPREVFYEVSGESERQEVVHAAQTTPCVIVTTSGMLAGGPVVEYARHLLPQRRHRIVLTGYQDEGAPSKALRGAIGAGRIEFEDERGEPVVFHAALPAKEVGLSSHADQPGLVEYATRLSPRHIVLVHGEPRCQEQLRSRLLQDHPKADIICGPSEYPVP